MCSIPNLVLRRLKIVGAIIGLMDKFTVCSRQTQCQLIEASRQVVYTFPKDSIRPHVQQGLLNRSLGYKEASSICVLHSRK